MNKQNPILRFAPSPNGMLHLGHAYSALVNYDLAKKLGGKLLLRFDNIDKSRCDKKFETEILHDLDWLEIQWHKTKTDEPIRRQSQHLAQYNFYLEKLKKLNLIYPAFLSRQQIKKIIASKDTSKNIWPHDPDGSPFYPGLEKNLSQIELQQKIKSTKNFNWRLNINKANKNIKNWGDIILANNNNNFSYHLAVVIDDFATNITHVVRGKDLQPATIIHQTLQQQLNLPSPNYQHHKLLYDEQGKKLSKSKGATSLKHWQQKGYSAKNIREKLGL